MPSVRASARPNLRGWQQAQTIPSEGGKTPTPPPLKDPLQRGALMHASMPLMASTSDAFQRQFYSSQNIPQQRIFPAKKGSGS